MDDTQVAFIFRENQFGSNPALPLNSLALPAYEALSANPAHHIIIEDNHFVCQCGRMDWYVCKIKSFIRTSFKSSILNFNIAILKAHFVSDMGLDRQC